MEPAAAHRTSAAQTTRLPRSYSLEEYLKREEKALERREYYNGAIIPKPMAKGPHNEIAANLITAVKNAVKTLPKTYRVFSSNQKVYLPELNFGLYPDALVVCEKPLYWDDAQLLLINPLLIIEILSKSTGAYDRGDKFSEYKTLSSFKEYVLVEQNSYRVETRFREEPNLWRETIVTDPAGSIAFKSIGCTIQLADIYENIGFETRALQRPKKRN